MTARQRQIVDFLLSFTSLNGYSPSYQEIADYLGLNSVATVHKHIHKHIHTMRRHGIVKLGNAASPRTIELVQTSKTDCSECAFLRNELNKALATIERMREHGEGGLVYPRT